MVSSRTLNRQRKVIMLKEVLSLTIDLLLLEHRGRDRINMAMFKELLNKVKTMYEIGR